MNKKLIVIASLTILYFSALVHSPFIVHSQRDEVPRIIVGRRSTESTRATGLLVRQEVEVNRTLVEQLSNLATQTSAEGLVRSPLTVNFNLLEGAGRKADFIGTVEYAAQQSPNTALLSGRLNQVPEGVFNIIIHRGLLGLRVFSPDGNYALHQDINGAYVIEQEDPNAPFLCKVLPPRRHRREGRPRPGFTREANGSLVDVLIVYMTSAKEYYNNNVANLERAVREMEAFANLALRRSLPDVNPPLQLRFVAIEEVPNTIGSTLEDYAFNSSGAPIRAKRDAHKADLVVVIRRTMDWAGQAFPMCDLESPNYYGRRAYTHVRVDYLEQIKTLPHEIGHLFGGQHNPAAVDSCSLYGDSRGHAFSAPDGQGISRSYGTILSYANAYNRIPGYSNPSVLYQGVATGIVGARNNARAIRDSRFQLSDYKISSNPLPGQPPVVNILAPQNGAQLPANTTFTVSVRITDNESVASAGLYWQHTNSYLNCPGSGGYWTCTKTGDVYNWQLDVSSGTRTYQAVATDNRGGVTISPFQTITLTSP
jgi:hypothetical protein